MLYRVLKAGSIHYRYREEGELIYLPAEVAATYMDSLECMRGDESPESPVNTNAPGLTKEKNINHNKNKKEK
jgi:hypothetical protein